MRIPLALRCSINELCSRLDLVREMQPVVLLVSLVLVSCRTACCNKNDTNKKEVVYLLTLLPYYDPDPFLNPLWAEGDNLQPVLDLAKDQINENTSLLENYTLELIHAKGGCHRVARTIGSFIEEAFAPNREKIMGTIGPGCSFSTIGLAPLLNRSELSIVMLHGSSSPTLASRSKYQYLLGTLGSTESFVEGFIFLLNESKWENVSILYDDSRLAYQNTLRLLLKSTKDRNITANFILFPASPSYIPLEAIRQTLSRIVFVMCSLELSQQIICLSSSNHMNLTYDTYQWVFMDHHPNELLQPVDFFYDKKMCTREDMAKALEMTVLSTYSLEPSDGVLLESNITYQDYLRRYEAYVENYNQMSNTLERNSTVTNWGTYLYDAVWAWALVLDNLTKTEGFRINSGSYGNLSQTKMIVNQFYETKFQGMSGEISFERETGFSKRKANLFQVSKGNITLVATIGIDLIQYNSVELIPDSFPNVIVRENHIGGIFLTITVIIQFLIVVLLHTFTLIHAKKPSVKASSPRLLHISYMGIYILAAGTFIWTLNSAAALDVKIRHIFCQMLWAWFLPLGFTLSFAPVALRTWRIYRIFEHYNSPGPFISDPLLIAGVISLVVVDVVFGVTWTSLKDSRFDSIMEENPDKSLLNNTLRVKIVCTSANYKVWISLVMAYKAAILSCVTIFAILTRKISNNSFTTNILRVLVYLMTILCVLGFSLYFLLFAVSFDPTDEFIVLSVTLNLMITIFIICVFVPPILPIL